MKNILRLPLLLAVIFLFTISSMAQDCKELHTVKKGETIFGIAKSNGITVEELIKANPVMNTVGYELKKGDRICIPYHSVQNNTAVQNLKPATKPAQTAPRPKAIRLGVMLPLHNNDGDGRRMVEYYRGILMACDNLKSKGIDIQVSAWNVDINADVRQFLSQQGAQDCDIIFGPLYTKQVPQLAAFTHLHNIKLVIPFSISGNDVESNPNVFQVYQNSEKFYAEVIRAFVNKFDKCHVVVIDCNDAKSDKGVFTFGLRKELEKLGRTCSITNLNNSEESFAKAFSTTKRNVVVLNTGRSPELTLAIRKLDSYVASVPSASVSLFGYTEWLMYDKYNLEKFFRYDTYIPTAAYYNSRSVATQQFEAEYRKAFRQPMLEYIPRFALTGYDHAMYFVNGLRQKGQSFEGESSGSDVLQTNLHFSRVKPGGGLLNDSFMFVHYNTNHSISVINY